MFALRRAAPRALSSRILFGSISSHPRSVTTLSPNFTRANYPGILQPFQRRSTSYKATEKDETIEEELVAEPVQPETTSAAEFDASDVQPIEAREVGQTAPADYESTRMPRNRTRDISPSKRLYIGNLFFDVTEEDLRKAFSRFGTVVDIKLIKDTHGLSKGFAYVSYLEQEEATSALEGLNKQQFEGRQLSVQYAAQKDQAFVARDRNRISGEGHSSPPSRTLYIGNMSFDLSDKDLSQLFAGIKNVIDVRVAIDRRTGQPRGFAHADFTDIESAENAFSKLNGKEANGRRLRCDYSGPASRVRSRSDDL